MMNIEQLTNRLAQMPDQALQQYAMMNKEDPYIMALALSESRRRKQMRTAAAPQQQARLKVADQALMEMAPAGGVDALPTEEMNFAGGGIVAFADGGDVERYSGEFGSLIGASTMGGFVPSLAQQDLASQAADLAAADRAKAANAAKIAALQKRAAELDYLAPEAAQNIRAEIAALTAAMPPAPTAAAAPRATPPAPAAAAAAPKTDGGLGSTPEAKAMRKPPAPAAAPAVGAPTVQDAKELAGQFYDTKAQKAEIDKYMAEQRADVAAARARREEGKPTGKAYSKYEEMLQAEEGRAGKERDEATGVAIFRAGLAMMGGTSPRAFENISKGALTGLDDYTSAMKDMKKSAKERQKAFADIENARRAEAREDWKAAQAFEDKAEARLDKAREIGIKGIMDVTGKSADISASLYKTGVEQQGAFQRAKLQADAMRDRGGNAGEKQTLAELKALQTNLKDQLKDPRMLGPKGDPLRAQLAQVNGAIANMAGLGTMTGAPGVTSPGGIPTDVQALLNKYGGK